MRGPEGKLLSWLTVNCSNLGGHFPHRFPVNINNVVSTKYLPCICLNVIEDTE